MEHPPPLKKNGEKKQKKKKKVNCFINGPASFQRWMDIVLGDLRRQGVLVYIDDILIHADNEEKLIDLLGQVLWRLSVAGAMIKMTKCCFGPSSFEYLGHQIEGTTRRPQLRKLEKYKHIRSPTTVKDVRSIIGMLNYYRVYIPKMADLIKPLTLLLRKTTKKFEWKDEHQQAVKEMVGILTTAILEVAPSGNTFRLETDASDIGMGAVLYDKEKYDKDPTKTLPIRFMSQAFKPEQQRWSINERELYAVLWALESCQTIIFGKEVHVYTDHKNLPGMIQSDKTPKVTRWMIRLAVYNPTVHYIKGSENVVADFLSRQMVEDERPEHFLFACPAIKRGCPLPEHQKIEIQEAKRQKRSTVEKQRIPLDVSDPSYNSELDFPTEWTVILKEPPEKQQHKDIHPLHYIQDYDFPTMEELKLAQQQDPPEHTKGYFRDAQGWIGYLKGYWVPPSLRRQILDAVHLNATLLHPGERKMKQLIRRMYDWKGQVDDIRDYIHSCLTCQRNRPLFHQPDAIQYKHPMTGPNDNVYMDLWGPVTFNNKTFTLLTMVDFFTKWAEAVPLQATDSTTIAHAFFNHWVCRHGAPKVLTTDNGSNFVAPALSKVCAMIGSRQLRSCTYHPKGNSPVERFHQTLKKTFKYMRIVAPTCTEIQEMVSYALLCYRMMPHESTKQSPAYLTYGVDLVLRNNDYLMTNAKLTDEDRTRLEILGQYRQELAQQYELQRIYLKDNETTGRVFKIGDLVLLHLTPAEQQRYSHKLNCSIKVTPEWSLPMRVHFTSPKGNTATLVDIVTGAVQQAHLDRVRFLKKPLTKGLRKEWIHVIREEEKHFRPSKKNKAEYKKLMGGLPNSTSWVEVEAQPLEIAQTTLEDKQQDMSLDTDIFINVDEDLNDN